MSEEKVTAYLAELKPFIDQYDNLKIEKRNISLLKLHFYPLAAYLLRSTVDWDEIKDDLVSELSNTLPYYTAKSGKQSPEATREYISKLMEKFEEAENKAAEEGANLMTALIECCIDSIEHGKVQIPLTIYTTTFLVTNEIVKKTEVTPYADALAPVPQYLGMPSGTPDPVKTAAGRIIPLEWAGVIRYNGKHYYYMKEVGGNGTLIGEMYQHKDHTFSLNILEGKDWENLNKLYTRLVFDRLSKNENDPK